MSATMPASCAYCNEDFETTMNWISKNGYHCPKCKQLIDAFRSKLDRRSKFIVNLIIFGLIALAVIIATL